MTGLYRSSQVCIIVTGASRGFGVALATSLAHHYRQQFQEAQDETSSRLTFILLARDEHQLDRVSQDLQLIDQRIQVKKVACDLSTVGSIVLFEQILNQLDHHSQHYLMVHNAGSLGNIKQRCKDITVTDAVQRDKYYRLNLYSVMEMSSILLRHLSSLSNVTLNLINISSLAAIQPFLGMQDYCISKAAREAFFLSLMNELRQEPGNLERVRILNYAPGPLQTDMWEQIKEMKQFETVVPLTPNQSATKLIQLLAADKYDDGAHVDYYDQLS